jgi:hypothetical protein
MKLYFKVIQKLYFYYQIFFVLKIMLVNFFSGKTLTISTIIIKVNINNFI